jgi:hypothetical protein
MPGTPRLSNKAMVRRDWEKTERFASASGRDPVEIGRIAGHVPRMENGA